MACMHADKGPMIRRQTHRNGNRLHILTPCIHPWAGTASQYKHMALFAASHPLRLSTPALCPSCPRPRLRPIYLLPNSPSRFTKPALESHHLPRTLKAHTPPFLLHPLKAPHQIPPAPPRSALPPETPLLPRPHHHSHPHHLLSTYLPLRRTACAKATVATQQGPRRRLTAKSAPPKRQDSEKKNTSARLVECGRPCCCTSERVDDEVPDGWMDVGGSV